MDLLVLIKSQIDRLPSELRDATKLRFVLSHIERAELFLAEAARTTDDQYNTDAIYRSNQAYEAILKEAYSYFTGKDSSKKNPFEIEEYILKNKILNSRVTDLLTNYRTQWRNPSTHDYSLTFSEQEALVGVVSVQMFIKVLLDQIMVENSFRLERERMAKTTENREKYEKLRALPLPQYVAELCLKFASGVFSRLESPNTMEIEGILEAYISGWDADLEIQSQSRSSGGLRGATVRPDFTIQRGEESVVLKFKVGYKQEYEADTTRRLVQYMINFKPKHGIVLFLERGKSKYEKTESEFTNTIEKVELIVIAPMLEAART